MTDTEFWKIVYPDGMSAEQVTNELYDYHRLLDGLPQLYDHITNGAISKPNTDKTAIIAVHDDYVARQIDDATKEMVKALQILLRSHDCLAPDGSPEIPEEISAQFDINLDDARAISELTLTP